MAGGIAEIDIIQSDILKSVERAARNGMVPNASKSRYLHFWSNPSLTLLFPKQDGAYVPLYQVLATKVLDVIVQNNLRPRAQVDAAVVKDMSMLAFMQITFERLTPGIFLSVYNKLVSPLLDYFLHVW